MKKQISMAVAVAATVLLVGCGSETPETASNVESLSSEAELVSADTGANGFTFHFTAWRENPSDGALAFTDAIEVTEARVEEGTLVIGVRHGGGCRAHDYQVTWNGVFRESDPVQIGVVTGHDANADSCRALLTSTLRVPLESLRAAWRTAYNAEHGSISIHLDETALNVVDTF